MEKIHPNYRKRLMRDLLFVCISIIFAILLLEFGILDSFLEKTKDLGMLSAFIFGFFFTSVFTIAPATIALAKLSLLIDPMSLAFFGAAGAMIGDLIIFLFIRDVFTEDLVGVTKRFHIKKILSKLHLGFLRWFLPLVGACIIISPLPDELGLTLMGISKIRIIYLIPLAFVLNFIAVLLVSYVASAI